MSDSLDQILGYFVLALALYLVVKTAVCKDNENYDDVKQSSSESEDELPSGEAKAPNAEKINNALGLNSRLTDSTAIDKLKEDVKLDHSAEQADDDAVEDFVHRQSVSMCDRGNDNGDDFLNEFANFRSKTMQMSNQDNKDELVEKVVELYLGENTTPSRRFKGKSISEVYNMLTKGRKSDLKCAKVPLVDGENKEGSHVVKGFRGEMFTGDNWRYDGENQNNGGKIEGASTDLFANDPAVEDNLVL